MGRRGFTQQELRDIFNLDPDRPEDRPAIAALQASAQASTMLALEAGSGAAGGP